MDALRILQRVVPGPRFRETGPARSDPQSL